MSRYLPLGACTLAALLVAGSQAADPLKSGPQVGQKVTAFSPLNINGPDAGKKVCQV